MKDKKEEESLFKWMFTFNPFRNVWCAFYHGTHYLNGENEDVHTNKDLDVLIKNVKDGKYDKK